MSNVFEKRFLELDLLRGVAVVGMIVFHFFFILDFYGVKESAMREGGWEVLGQFVRFTFLGLVGVGMVISYGRVVAGGRWLAISRQWKRGTVILIAALVVSLATYLFLGEKFYVRFGILHLIAVSIFFWSFFVEWKWAVLVLSLVSFWAGGWSFGKGFGVILNSGAGGGFGFGAGFGAGGGFGEWLGSFSYFLRAGAGFGAQGVSAAQAIDYFPLFPWMGIVGVGIFIGHLYVDGRWFKRAHAVVGVGGFPGRVLRWFVGFVGVLQVVGRYSLAIYLLHVPLIVLGLWITGRI